MNGCRFLWCLMVLCGGCLSFASAQPANDLAEKARKAHLGRDFQQSAQLFAAAIEHGADDPDVFYSAAGSFSVTGKSNEALVYLEQAINRGYQNVQMLKADAELVSLHNDPRWPVLVKRCEANAAVAKMVWHSSALDIPFKENLSDDEKVAGLSKFWSEVKFNFANFDLVPGLDWDALYLSYLPKVRQTKNTVEYYRTLMELCARLRDGHTDVFPPDALADEFSARPPFRTRLIDGRVIVRAVYDRKLRDQGVVPGVEILEVQGLPVKQYAEQRVMPYQSSSTEQERLEDVYEFRLLWGPRRELLEITFQDSQGRSFKRSIARVTAKEFADLNRTQSPVPLMSFKMLPGNLGYLALNSFQDQKIDSQFAEAFDEIQKSDAIIIDIRNNGGGTSSIGFTILQYFTKEPFKTSRWKTRDYRPALRAWGQPERWYVSESDEWKPNVNKAYTKPVILLISPRTGSAAEDFAVAFDSMKRGQIVGEPTIGSTGQPLLITLPGGGSARICTKRDTYPDGKEFVGVGVQPNFLVQQTLADFRADRDTALEFALAKLSSRQSH